MFGFVNNPKDSHQKVRKTWVLIPPLPLACCVAMGQLSNLSEPPLLAPASEGSGLDKAQSPA